MTERWEVTVEEDEHGDIILPFPPELIDRYNWQEGDEIDFKITDDGVVITNTTARERDKNKGNIA